MAHHKFIDILSKKGVSHAWSVVNSFFFVWTRADDKKFGWESILFRFRAAIESDSVKGHFSCALSSSDEILDRSAIRLSVLACT